MRTSKRHCPLADAAPMKHGACALATLTTIPFSVKDIPALLLLTFSPDHRMQSTCINLSVVVGCPLLQIAQALLQFLDSACHHAGGFDLAAVLIPYPEDRLPHQEGDP
jgi:hypothetical protein